MILKIKTGFISLLVKIIVKHPGFMESKLFLKAMQVFPEMISTRYDDSIEPKEGEYLAPLKSGLINIHIKPQKILDLCTGTGNAAFTASRLFPDAKIVAIDQSDSMIKIAQKKAIEMNFVQVEFKKENAAKLNEADNSFDLVLTANAPVYISEAIRVLKPGGIFLAAYSYGGDAFLANRAPISVFLNTKGLTLLELKNANKGAYFLCKKSP
jgi:SAM-dependent methyltransferase